MPWRRNFYRQFLAKLVKWMPPMDEIWMSECFLDGRVFITNNSPG